MVFIRIHGICCCPHDVGCDGAGTTSPGETMKRERVVLRESAMYSCMYGNAAIIAPYDAARWLRISTNSMETFA